jgi:hypothetical protein
MMIVLSGTGRSSVTEQLAAPSDSARVQKTGDHPRRLGLWSRRRRWRPTGGRVAENSTPRPSCSPDARPEGQGAASSD